MSLSEIAQRGIPISSNRVAGGEPAKIGMPVTARSLSIWVSTPLKHGGTESTEIFQISSSASPGLPALLAPRSPLTFQGRRAILP